jgi:translation elongation factor EF-4
MSGFVYIIACAEPKSIKVGYTTRSPAARLKQLQTGCPSQLVLVGWYPAEKSEETELHRQLQKYRLSGEWFSLCEEISAALQYPMRAIMVNNILTGHNP